MELYHLLIERLGGAVEATDNMALEREPVPGQVLRSRRHGINVEVKSVQYTAGSPRCSAASSRLSGDPSASHRRLASHRKTGRRRRGLNARGALAQSQRRAKR